MELVFNELSVNFLSGTKLDADNKMKFFSEAVAALRKEGFKNIRSPSFVNDVILSEGYSLHDWLLNKDVSEVLRNNLYGILIYPFIKDEDEEIEARYIEAEFYFEDAKNGIKKTECLGLAAAHLYDTATVSLSSSAAWQKNLLDITVKSAEKVSKEHVLNIYSKACLNTTDISHYIEHAFDLELVESAITPSDKGIHLSDHHGKSELTAFTKRIKNNPYVNEIWSTDWGGSKFIRKVGKDGLIEIVFTDTQRRYALLIQTTGRNYRETLEISEILKEKYS